MARIELSTFIAAPAARCFDLARSIDFHARAATASRERAVDGKRTGLLELGEDVTWKASHFGVTQRLSVRMTALDRPRHFQDVMLRGAFKGFTHDHSFEVGEAGTVMRDVFEFTAPFGPLGRLAEVLFLEGYMRNFLVARNRRLKAALESAEWTAFLPHGP